MGLLWTKEQFGKRLDILFPEWKYDIIEYSGFKKQLIIKCLNCGEILNFKAASQIFSRRNACKCYNYFPTYKDKVIYLGKKFNFKIEDLKSIKFDKVTTTCLKCGTSQTRTCGQINLAPNHCPGCSDHKDSQLSISMEEAQKRLDDSVKGYEILEYSGITKPALIRHSCGFIFKTSKLCELISQHNSGCPKCKTTKSKGAKAIENFLIQSNIDYIAEKSFLPEGKKYKYRFDFYLPDYNIAIEYQGEQHFRDNGFAREGLKAVQERDQIKRDYCKENNIILIEISYKQLKEINHILSSRFNDYGVSQQLQVK